VRVISGIADVDFNVHSISREGPCLVVRDRAGAGLATVVYLTPADIAAGLKALLASPAALGFVLTAPFRRANPTTTASGATARDDVNNPWK
jgi:hypothetical protein